MYLTIKHLSGHSKSQEFSFQVLRYSYWIYSKCFIPLFLLFLINFNFEKPALLIDFTMFFYFFGNFDKLIDLNDYFLLEEFGRSMEKLKLMKNETAPSINFLSWDSWFWWVCFAQKSSSNAGHSFHIWWCQSTHCSFSNSFISCYFMLCSNLKDLNERMLELIC